MAIDIEWRVNLGDRDSDDVKSRITPHVVNSEIIDDQKLAEILSKNSTYTRGMVLSMLLDLSETMADLLREGKTIDIPSLGTFRLYVGAATKVTLSGPISAMKAKVNGIHFRPSKEFKDSISTASFCTVARNASTMVPSATSLIPGLTDYFKKHDSITRTEFASLFKLKRPTAFLRIKELINMGVIKSTGNNRGTKYVKA